MLMFKTIRLYQMLETHLSTWMIANYASIIFELVSGCPHFLEFLLISWIISQVPLHPCSSILKKKILSLEPLSWNLNCTSNFQLEFLFAKFEMTTYVWNTWLPPCLLFLVFTISGNGNFILPDENPLSHFGLLSVIFIWSLLALPSKYRQQKYNFFPLHYPGSSLPSFLACMILTMPSLVSVSRSFKD